jgi:phospholipid/cholesterol/gamma-HCH transport system substrate-binding protein
MALLYWGINFLRGESVFSKERVFIALYDDVAGLKKSNPITINGLQVGQVRDMYFSKDGKARIVLELIIRNDLPIPKNSTAKIISSDLLGSKAVELKLGTSQEFAQPGDTLISELEISIKEEVNRQLRPIKLKAENLMFQIDTVISMLQSLVSDDNTNNFSKSVKHIANSFENLESTTSTLDTIMTSQKIRLENILKNIESITLNLNQNKDNFNNILTNFSSLSDTLAKIQFTETMANVNKAMKDMASISEKINRGEGTMGMLINNDSLYIELEKSSRDLNLLLEDIRLNPKKYVRFSVF